MRQLAQVHGQAGWHAHAFPLSVDGLEIVASLVLLAGHRSGRRPGWLPWAALVLGTVGSLAANVATAGPGAISRIIAGWPALALLIAVKLLTGMLNLPAITVPQPPAGQDHPGQPRRFAVLPDRPAEGVPATSGSSIPNRLPTRQRAGRSQANEPRRAAGPEPGIVGLLAAARAVRDDLQRAGQPLTRDSLAARLREGGHPIRNSRLTPVLQTLHSESAIPAPQARRSGKPPDLSGRCPDLGQRLIRHSLN
jgi:Protein of unknown function (DUF2637)